MSTADKMTIDECYKYLRIRQKQYRVAQILQEKSALLDEMPPGPTATITISGKEMCGDLG